MKNMLLALFAVSVMNAMVNASSCDNVDPDFQKQKQQILQALQIFAKEVKPATLRKSIDNGGTETDVNVPAVDTTMTDVKPSAAEIAEELVPAAGKPQSLDIPSADYVAQMKASRQQFEGLAKAVDAALKPAYSVAVGNIGILQLPSESLSSLRSQESALKKQLKRLNAKDVHRHDYMDGSGDEEESDSPRNCHRNDKQPKESEAKKEQIKKQLQIINEKIKQHKVAKKHAHGLEQFKRIMLDHQNNAKADNFRITKSTARLQQLFDQANSERQKQFQEQIAALTDSLKERLLEIDKEFAEKCKVTQQKAAQLIEKYPDQAQKAQGALAVDIDLYTKKHKTLKRLAKLQSKRAQALLSHGLAAELASFKLEYEQILADFQTEADIADLIISEGLREPIKSPKV